MHCKLSVRVRSTCCYGALNPSIYATVTIISSDLARSQVHFTSSLLTSRYHSSSVVLRAASRTVYPGDKGVPYGTRTTATSPGGRANLPRRSIGSTACGWARKLLPAGRWPTLAAAAKASSSSNKSKLASAVPCTRDGWWLSACNLLASAAGSVITELLPVPCSFSLEIWGAAIYKVQD